MAIRDIVLHYSTSTPAIEIFEIKNALGRKNMWCHQNRFLDTNADANNQVDWINNHFSDQLSEVLTKPLNYCFITYKNDGSVTDEEFITVGKDNILTKISEQ